jgi:hypothetical protein
LSVKRFLTEKQVRLRYGVSAMTMWRWDHQPDLGFPPAIRINKRKYRDEAALDAFDEALKRIALAELVAEGRVEVADASAT